MQPHHRKTHGGVCGSQRIHAFDAVEVDVGQEQFSHTRTQSALQHGLPVIGELLVVQVSVGIDEHAPRR